MINKHKLVLNPTDWQLDLKSTKEDDSNIVAKVTEFYLKQVGVGFGNKLDPTIYNTLLHRYMLEVSFPEQSSIKMNTSSELYYHYRYMLSYLLLRQVSTQIPFSIVNKLLNNQVLITDVGAVANLLNRVCDVKTNFIDKLAILATLDMNNYGGSLWCDDSDPIIEDCKRVLFKFSENVRISRNYAGSYETDPIQVGEFLTHKLNLENTRWSVVPTEAYIEHLSNRVRILTTYCWLVYAAYNPILTTNQ